MKIKAKFGVVAAILLMTIVACRKESKFDNPWMAEITKNKHENVSAIFKEINHVSLKTAIDAKNESKIQSIVNDAANNVASYFF